MALPWKLIRYALWLAIAAFVASGIVGLIEEPLGWSDDPRWDTYLCGWALTFLALVGAVIAKIIAVSRKSPSRFPTKLLLVAAATGVLIMLAQILIHLDEMGPMGVV